LLLAGLAEAIKTVVSFWPCATTVFNFSCRAILLASATATILNGLRARSGWLRHPGVRETCTGPVIPTSSTRDSQRNSHRRFKVSNFAQTPPRDAGQCEKWILVPRHIYIFANHTFSRKRRSVFGRVPPVRANNPSRFAGANWPFSDINSGRASKETKDEMR
jgi:hypothetical protein